MIPVHTAALVAQVKPPPKAPAATPKDHVIAVTATVVEAPASITLTWPALPGSDGITVYRKSLEDTSWGPVYAKLSDRATGYQDTNVRVGVGYEYRVESKQGRADAYGYAYCGIALPLAESRGKVVLLVDATQAAPLRTELQRLERDLVGDGWTVVRHDVPRQAKVAAAGTAAEVGAVKKIIDSDYRADPGAVKAVFLFGRVAYPYSGAVNPDGHDNHLGAWPADVYYTQVGVTWPDALALSTHKRNANQPGDGKFDPTYYDPTRVRFAVGRVDLSGMIAFKTPETELLRRYLDKDHAFRHRATAYRPRCVVSDHFGEFRGAAFAQNGWRIATLVGAENVIAGDLFADTASIPTLWAYGCGPGSDTSAVGVGNTGQFVREAPRAVFNMLFGSYNGDFDNYNNFLRACLASQGAGLTCTWGGMPNWFWHHMGMGEPIGTSVRQCQANFSLYEPVTRKNAGRVHCGFLGDPTLRLHVLAPPGEVRASRGALAWRASPDAGTPGFLGYHVYRAATPAGPFVRLTREPVAGTAWTDPSPAAQSVYQVRAIRLETSTTGTYVNNSQGIFSK